MDYQQSRAYIAEAQKYGSVLGLANMKELMERLGNPQDTLKIVHVGGTNGKGSVIAYLYTVLSEAGYRVGRYNSPTLYSYRERMEIAGERISRESFARCLTEVARVIQEMTKEGLPHPTPFEIETAVAFLFFKEENCDLVLCEVGLGGTTDATNVIKQPVLSVIVSVSIDHKNFLGDSLRGIAQVKAGIIKPGCPMITTKQMPEAEAALREACEACGVIYTETDASEAVVLEESVEGETFLYGKEEYRISLGGVYQLENAVLALGALDVLGTLGFPTALEERKRGFLNVRWNGRLTVLHKKPLFVVDGAHNAAAADKMAVSIRHYFKDKKIYYIMGMFHDKDYRTVIQKTHSYAAKILTIEAPDNPRALPAEKLAEAVKEFHQDVEACPSLQSAVDKAFSLAGPDDVILAFGSLSFIAALSAIVENRED